MGARTFCVMLISVPNIILTYDKAIQMTSTYIALMCLNVSAQLNTHQKGRPSYHYWHPLIRSIIRILTSNQCRISWVLYDIFFSKTSRKNATFYICSRLDYIQNYSSVVGRFKTGQTQRKSCPFPTKYINRLSPDDL